MHGILYLESEPKFEVEIPTAKANMKVKIRQNWRVSSPMILFNTLRGLFRKITTIVNPRKNKASSADNITIGLFASHGYGRNRVTLILAGAFSSIPNKVGSISP